MSELKVFRNGYADSRSRQDACGERPRGAVPALGRAVEQLGLAPAARTQISTVLPHHHLCHPLKFASWVLLASKDPDAFLSSIRTQSGANFVGHIAALLCGPGLDTGVLPHRDLRTRPGGLAEQHPTE